MPRVTKRHLTKTPVRKRFGQHFLEYNWVCKLLDLIQPAPGEFFFEVGAGRGELTLPIAASGAQVAAVEIDRDLADNLRRIAPPKVRVVTADILTRDLWDLVVSSFGSDPPNDMRLIGNLPYNQSSPILLRILRTQRKHRCFRDASLMLQQEVADRVIASPGSRSYGPLAILTRLIADPRRILTLPPGAFRPPPKVRSAVVTLSFLDSPIAVPDPALFERMVRSLFTRRRKTLLNAIGPFARTVTSTPLRALLNEANLEPELRPEVLDLEDFVNLSKVLRVEQKASSSTDPNRQDTLHRR